eukprot:TRINITY_DN19501_c0_g1_i6.p1 TRINITY_DN19501_c0_g1~~TRINITY_DN19501_c0_g1_i6.p1  ORF type:complete len:258 (-),score=67.41 TRINITY_DN19501_c0_g1_i6:5-778(-)
MSVISQLQRLSSDLKDLQGAVKGNMKTIQAVPLASLVELDPAVHTAAFVMVLAAKASVLREPDFKEFFSVTELFLRGCRGELATDDSLREMTWSSLGPVCDKFAYVAIRLKCPAKAIQPLACAVELVRCGSPTALTAAHPALVQACLSARMYHAALPFIESPALTQASKCTGCRPRDVLTYLYYSGRVYLGTKQFSKATSLFLRALAMPADLSLIHISEPTRLLSISYAVFCLKKKKKKLHKKINEMTKKTIQIKHT